MQIAFLFTWDHRSEIQYFDTKNHDDSKEVIDHTIYRIGRTFDEFELDIILWPGNGFIAVRSVTTSSKMCISLEYVSLVLLFPFPTYR